MNEQAIRQAAALIRSAKNTVILTGAGLSTASGIPDFRSRHSGLWEQHNPVEIASIFGFKRRPEAFYAWFRPLVETVLNAQPNAAHTAIAQLEAAGYVHTIITQNIDMLHEKAGSHSILEVHGQLKRATCIECFTVYDAAPAIRAFLNTGDIPRCAACGGVLKPNVILFGEQLPVRELFAAKQAARHCDLMIAAGSSLQVAPIGDLPLVAKQYDAQLIIMNYEATHADKHADLIFQENLADLFPRIAAAVTEADNA